MSAVNLDAIKARYKFNTISVSQWRNPSASVLPFRGGTAHAGVSPEALSRPFMPTYRVRYPTAPPVQATDDEESDDEDDEEEPAESAPKPSEPVPAESAPVAENVKVALKGDAHVENDELPPPPPAPDAAVAPPEAEEAPAPAPAPAAESVAPEPAKEVDPVDKELPPPAIFSEEAHAPAEKEAPPPPPPVEHDAPAPTPAPVADAAIDEEADDDTHNIPGAFTDDLPPPLAPVARLEEVPAQVDFLDPEDLIDDFGEDPDEIVEIIDEAEHPHHELEPHAEEAAEEVAAPPPPPPAPSPPPHDEGVAEGDDSGSPSTDDTHSDGSSKKEVSFAPGTPDPKPTVRKKKGSKSGKSRPKKRVAVPIDSLPPDILAVPDTPPPPPLNPAEVGIDDSGEVADEPEAASEPAVVDAVCEPTPEAPPEVVPEPAAEHASEPAPEVVEPIKEVVDVPPPPPPAPEPPKKADEPKKKKTKHAVAFMKEKPPVKEKPAKEKPSKEKKKKSTSKNKSTSNDAPAAGLGIDMPPPPSETATEEVAPVIAEVVEELAQEVTVPSGKYDAPTAEAEIADELPVEAPAAQEEGSPETSNENKKAVAEVKGDIHEVGEPELVESEQPGKEEEQQPAESAAAEDTALLIDAPEHADTAEAEEGGVEKFDEAISEVIAEAVAEAAEIEVPAVEEKVEHGVEGDEPPAEKEAHVVEEVEPLIDDVGVLDEAPESPADDAGPVTDEVSDEAGASLDEAAGLDIIEVIEEGNKSAGPTDIAVEPAKDKPTGDEEPKSNRERVDSGFSGFEETLKEGDGDGQHPSTAQVEDGVSAGEDQVGGDAVEEDHDVAKDKDEVPGAFPGDERIFDEEGPLDAGLEKIDEEPESVQSEASGPASTNESSTTEPEHIVETEDEPADQSNEKPAAESSEPVLGKEEDLAVVETSLEEVAEDIAAVASRSLPDDAEAELKDTVKAADEAHAEAAQSENIPAELTGPNGDAEHVPEEEIASAKDAQESAPVEDAQKLAPAEDGHKETQEAPADDHPGEDSAEPASEEHGEPAPASADSEEVPSVDQSQDSAGKNEETSPGDSGEAGATDSATEPAPEVIEAVDSADPVEPAQPPEAGEPVTAEEAPTKSEPIETSAPMTGEDPSAEEPNFATAVATAEDSGERTLATEESPEHTKAGDPPVETVAAAAAGVVVGAAAAAAAAELKDPKGHAKDSKSGAHKTHHSEKHSSQKRSSRESKSSRDKESRHSWEIRSSDRPRSSGKHSVRTSSTKDGYLELPRRYSSSAKIKTVKPSREEARAKELARKAEEERRLAYEDELHQIRLEARKAAREAAAEVAREEAQREAEEVGRRRRREREREKERAFEKPKTSGKSSRREDVKDFIRKPRISVRPDRPMPPPSRDGERRRERRDSHRSEEKARVREEEPAVTPVVEVTPEQPRSTEGKRGGEHREHRERRHRHREGEREGEKSTRSRHSGEERPRARRHREDEKKSSKSSKDSKKSGGIFSSLLGGRL